MSDTAEPAAAEPTPEANPAPEAVEPATAPPAEGTPEPEAPEEFDAARALAQVRKANAQAKAMRERAQAAETKAQTLEASANEAATLRAELMRTQVALDLGIPMAIMKRIQGDTVEELKADAEEFLGQMVPKTPARAPGTTRPVEAMQTGSGKAGGTGPVQYTQADLERMKPDAVAAALAAGQLADLMGGKSP
jgi:hypothetical protein